MVICATRGDRACHIVVLHDDDQIVWDFGMKISLLKWARNTRRQLFRLHCTGSSVTSRTAMSPSLFCASTASRRSNLESKVIQLNRKRSRKGREERPRLSTTTCSVPSFTCPGRRRMRSHVKSCHVMCTFSASSQKASQIWQKRQQIPPATTSTPTATRSICTTTTWTPHPNKTRTWQISSLRAEQGQGPPTRAATTKLWKKICRKIRFFKF